VGGKTTIILKELH